jgi:hypothetical protein
MPLRDTNHGPKKIILSVSGECLELSHFEVLFHLTLCQSYPPKSGSIVRLNGAALHCVLVRPWEACEQEVYASCIRSPGLRNVFPSRFDIVLEESTTKAPSTCSFRAATLIDKAALRRARRRVLLRNRQFLQLDKILLID